MSTNDSMQDDHGAVDDYVIIPRSVVGFCMKYPAHISLECVAATLAMALELGNDVELEFVTLITEFHEKYKERWKAEQEAETP